MKSIYVLMVLASTTGFGSDHFSDCSIGKEGVFVENSTVLFNGMNLSDPMRESVGAYVRKIKKQSQLVRELLFFGLTQQAWTEKKPINTWEKLIENLDSNGRDLKVTKRKMVRDTASRELYEVEWGSGDTSVGAMVEVLGQVANERGKPYVLKLVGLQGDGDWYDCDPSIR